MCVFFRVGAVIAEIAYCFHNMSCIPASLNLYSCFSYNAAYSLSRTTF